MTYSHCLLSGVATQSGSSLLFAGVRSLKSIFCDTAQCKGSVRRQKPEWKRDQNTF